MANNDDDIFSFDTDNDIQTTTNDSNEAQETPLDIVFNQNVHVTNSHGDPLRDDKGLIKLRPDWKSTAVDRQGRKYNPSVHGSEPALDDEGYLKVRRRESAGPMGMTNRTKAFVDRYKEPGYAYRVVNDDGGRLDMFHDRDWEPVIDPATKAPAQMKVGQARSPDTRAVLMRKPEEWFAEDQLAKRRLREQALKRNLAPDAEHGQYEATSTVPTNPLR